MEPNEHILNFHNSYPVIPEWLQGPLRLIIGAGDLNHNSMTNIEKFSTYNVFFCKPWLSTSLKENIDYLLANYFQKKVICFLDADNEEHIHKFVTVFKGRFSLIDGHGAHCPHLSFANIQKLLTEGGQAMNLFEKSENIMSAEQASYWLKNGHFDRIRDGFLTARISDRESDFKEGFLQKTKELLGKATRINCELQLETLSVKDLQYCCRALLFDSELPFNLIGSCSIVKKDWFSPILEFTVKKVSPDLKERMIADYIEKNGLDDYVERALFIVKKIQEDLEKGSLYASRKYSTLLKHLA